MANFPGLRTPAARTTHTGGLGLPGLDPRGLGLRGLGLRGPRIAAVALLLLVAAAGSAATLLVATRDGGRPADATPGFLTRDLGPARPAAPLVRKPAPHLHVTVTKHGFTYADGGAPPVSLGSVGLGGGAWQRYARGTLRTLGIGSEAVTVDGVRAEHLITVDRRQGRRLWQWRLDTSLQPRLAPNGAVGFIDPKTRQLLPLELLPVEVLDSHGRNVTPAGAHWTLAPEHGRTLLQLELDDAGLPLPYAIDPIVQRGTATSGVGVSPVTSAALPSTLEEGDLIVVQAAVGTGPTSSDTVALNDPTLSSGNDAFTQLTTEKSSANSGNAGADQKTWWERAVAGDAGATVSASWSSTAADSGLVQVVVLAGLETSAKGSLVDSSSQTSTSNTTVKLPSRTSGAFADGDYALGFAAIDDSTTFPNAPPANQGSWSQFSTVSGTALSATAWWQLCATSSGCTNTATTFDSGASTGRSTSAIATFFPDTTAPSADTLGFTAVSGASSMVWNGTNGVYYKPPASGSATFTLSATPTDTGSGVDSVTFPTTSTAGFTDGGGTVGYQTSGTYSSSAYTIDSTNSSSPGTLTVTATDNAGNTLDTSVTLAIDATAPSGGSVTPDSSYSSTGTYNVAVTSDTDSGSGVATETLTRQKATLSADACGTWSDDTTLTVAATVSETTLPAGYCYRYVLVTTDNLGNADTITSSAVHVDSTAPSAPTLSFGNLSGGAHYPGSGTTLYFNSAGGFTVTGSGSTDAETSVSGYSYSVSGSGWAADASGNYTFGSGSPTRTFDVTAQNPAGLSSAATSFTALKDTRAPTADTLGVTAGSQPSTMWWDGSSTLFYRTPSSGSASFTLSATPADTGTNPSGMYSVAFPAVSAIGFTGSGGTVTDQTSGTFASGQYTIDSTNTASPGSLTVTATDNAGNTLDSSIAFTLDNTAPSGGSLTPSTAASSTGTYTIGVSTDSDSGSGIASQTLTRQKATLSADACGGWSDDTTLTITSTVHESALAPGCYRYVLVTTDEVGNTDTITSSEVHVDSTAPSAPDLAISNVVGAYYPGSGTSLYFNSAGSFTVTASGSTDAETGVSGYTYPVSGTGWSADASGDYTFTASSGTKTFDVTAQNPAGLSSAATSVTATKDTASPSAGASAITCNGGSCSGWYGGASVAVAISGTDSASGVKRIVYTTDGTTPAFDGNDNVTNGTAVSGDTATIALSTTGATTLTWVAEDNVGNISNAASKTVDYDGTGPSAPTGIAVTATTNAYYSGSGSTVYFRPGVSGGFKIVASGSADDESGVAGYTYPDLGSGWTQSSGVYTFDATATTQTGGITAQNKATPAGDSTALDITAHADTTAPTSAIQCDLNTCTTAWSTSTVHVDLAASDAQADVYRIIWTTDGTDPAVDPSTDNITNGSHTNGSAASFSISSNGVTAVKWIAEDNVGNVSAVQSKDVYKDSSSPSSPGDVSFGSFTHAYWPGSGTTVYFQGGATGGFTASASGATDSDSGISGYTYPDLGTGWTQSGGVYTFDATAGNSSGGIDATNGAGLTGGNLNFTTRSDSTAPDTSITCNAATCTSSWYSGAVTIDLSATDPGASAADVKRIVYTTNGTDPAIDASDGVTNGTEAAGASASLSVSTDGTTTVKWIAEDNVGNISSVSSQAVQDDVSAPTGSVTDPGSVLSGTVSLAATADDGSGSGVASVELQAAAHGTSTWQSLGTATTAPYSVSANTTTLTDGAYDLRAVVTDNVGHTGDSATLGPRTVDNTPPTLSLTAPADGGYVNAAAANPYTVTAAASDTGTGVSQVDFFTCTSAACTSTTLLGTDTTASGGNYSISWTLPGDGPAWLKAVATDGAGHSSSSIAAFTVDRTPPDTTLVTNPGSPSNAAHPVFSFSASESTQGYECRLDGGAWASCSSPDTLSSTPADGTHTFEVRAIDLAGNTDASPASWTWLEDTTAPTASLDDPASGNAAHSVRGSVSLSATVADPGAHASGIASTTYEYSSDGTSWVATPSTWDTTGVADGVYDLRVTALDNAGNSTTSTLVTGVKVDNSAPAISVTDPGAYMHGTVTLTATATDPNDSSGDTGSGIASVAFQLSPAGQDTWTTEATATSSPYSAGVDTTGLTDGSYDLRALVTDGAGNQTASAAATGILVDNTKPQVTLATVASNLRGTVTLSTSSATDPGANASGVDTTTYAASPTGASSWTTVSSTWNTAGVSDGLYDVEATVTDKAGNVSDASMQTGVRVDNTAPVTTASGVPSGYSDSPVTVTLSPSDSGSGVADTTYQVDGGAAQHGTSVTIAAPSNGSNDGSHTVAFSSTDVAGNVETQKSVTVLIDATPPVCSSCSASDYLSGTVTLTATTTDSGGAGLSSVTFQESADGTTWHDLGAGVAGSGSDYTYDWNTTGVADGAYHLQAVIVDGAGNTTTVDLHSGGAGVVVVDNTAPTVSVGAPSDGAFVSGTTTLSATASDANALTYSFLVDGTQVATGSSPTASWDSTSVADGTATIRIEATDPAGNSTTSSSVTVTVDNVAPAPALADPGSPLAGAVTLSATSDADTASIEFQDQASGSSSWSTIATVAASPFQTSFATSSVADGSYLLRAFATDTGGHTGASATRSVVVDNTAPTGSLDAPRNGEILGGTVTMSATASDATSGVASVEFDERLSGSGSWTAIGTVTSSPYSLSWDTNAVAVGSYDLRVAIADDAGNTYTTPAETVTVNASPSSISLGSIGSSVSGSITLSADGASSASSVAFQVSRAGASAWQTISTDTASPWSATFDTATLADSSYDFRAVATDSSGNTGTSTISGVAVDNHAPSVVSSSPADGATVKSADSISVTASEQVTFTGVTLDGHHGVSPSGSGTSASFATGPLADGLHELTGTIVDQVGHSTRFMIHFLVQPAAATQASIVVQNVYAGSTTTVKLTGGGASVVLPADAWTSKSDWLVVSLAPRSDTFLPTTSLHVLSAIEIDATWALGGTSEHAFSAPLDVTLDGAGDGTLAATSEDGLTWRMIPPVPQPGVLPDGWQDGFYRVGSTMHILTRHLSTFAVIDDKTPPAAPSNIHALVWDGKLELQWTPGADNSGTVSEFHVYRNDTPIGTLGAGGTFYTVGPYSLGDTAAYSVSETDAAGNESARSRALVVVPALQGLTLAQAVTVLGAHGLSAGALTGVVSDRPAGTVVGETPGTALDGTSIPLQLSTGQAPATVPFVFTVVATRTLPLATRNFIGVHLSATWVTRIAARLLDTRGRVVHSWHVTVRAGTRIVKLPLPKRVRKTGSYALRWVATSGGAKVHKLLRVRIVPSAKGLPRSGPVDVVLAGLALRSLPLPTSAHRVRHVFNASRQTAFSLAGAPHKNVQVIVVDVDVYGPALIRQLKTVFPMMKIIAISKSPLRLVQSIRAGATVALPKGLPPKKLARVIAGLAGSTSNR